MYMNLKRVLVGGGGEIRTRGAISHTLAFQASTLDRSATPPL